MTQNRSLVFAMPSIPTTVVVFAAMLCAGAPCVSQSLRLDWGDNGYANFQLNGTTLSGHEHQSSHYDVDSPPTTQDSDFSVDISDLDLDNVFTSSQAPYFVFSCKGNNECVHYSSNTCSDSSVHCPSEFNSQSTNGFDTCPASSTEECTEFLNELRAALMPRRSAPAPQPETISQPIATYSQPRVADPASQQTPAGGNEFHDLLASLNWVSASGSMPPGTSPLDNLVRNMKPAPKPAQPQRPTYAAFSQAAGFDANGAWGVGTAADLNAAIGQAENTCHQGATMCGDEGYCMIRPGLWGAWASDLKVAGNTAFACNLPSEETARQQAQAWCGDGCKVLSTGAGQ